MDIIVGLALSLSLSPFFPSPVGTVTELNQHVSHNQHPGK